MAVIDTNGGVINNNGFFKVSWGPLANVDEGAWVQVARFPDMSVQAVGNFSGIATVAMEGSNDGGVTPFALNDPQGAPNRLAFGALSALSLFFALLPRAAPPLIVVLLTNSPRPSQSLSCTDSWRLVCGPRFPLYRLTRTQSGATGAARRR